MYNHIELTDQRWDPKNSEDESARGRQDQNKRGKGERGTLQISIGRHCASTHHPSMPLGPLSIQSQLNQVPRTTFQKCYEHDALVNQLGSARVSVPGVSSGGYEDTYVYKVVGIQSNITLAHSKSTSFAIADGSQHWNDRSIWCYQTRLQHIQPVITQRVT